MKRTIVNSRVPRPTPGPRSTLLGALCWRWDRKQHCFARPGSVALDRSTFEFAWKKSTDGLAWFFLTCWSRHFFVPYQKRVCMWALRLLFLSFSKELTCWFIWTRWWQHALPVKPPLRIWALTGHLAGSGKFHSPWQKSDSLEHDSKLAAPVGRHTCVS